MEDSINLMLPLLMSQVEMRNEVRLSTGGDLLLANNPNAVFDATNTLSSQLAGIPYYTQSFD